MIHTSAVDTLPGAELGFFLHQLLSRALLLEVLPGIGLSLECFLATDRSAVGGNAGVNASSLFRRHRIWIDARRA